ncbi:MAG: hypothetical protein A2W93_05200 [Bacteroidetes bacterium GWF2_43_63]|nr:MAG: hypothetical protein A2W94_11950 [Bacteroidetes bacterium GWE2_42_42]OFY56271.1 MAG: hypothetical protein A2W93_05200 [Bacteroidetes bacterium GWF2_43_63]HBG71949.1 hypothetical protein [Bacteroidales bacterium]HCB61850.1 hypothetical protein [Bacteroidales bacterium]HCY23872.1 hypothetical protein [Bacteroidales bacterium]
MGIAVYSRIISLSQCAPFVRLRAAHELSPPVLGSQSLTKFSTKSHKVIYEQKPFEKHKVVVLINCSKLNYASSLAD